MKVCKFGGSSLADAEAVSTVCGIVAADRTRRIVVVSAPGRRQDDDTKVTDLLIACAKAKLAGRPGEPERAAVWARYEEIGRTLGLPAELMEELEQSLRARFEADPVSRERYLDGMKAAGEDLCARLVAGALRARGVEAGYVSPAEAGLLLSAEHGNAVVLPESYANLASLRERQGVSVFPGFFGVTKEGVTVTFPRGGSDITAAAVAAAVKAEVYENFTDVDAVLAAEPSLVPEAQPIEELTYREMRELSYAGFAVLHDEALLPVVHAGIPICVKNTKRPDAPGTRIVPERSGEHGKVVGIASGGGFCTIFVSKYLMNREIGFGRRFLQIFEEEGLSYEHVPSGIDNLSIILRETALTPEAEQHVCRRLKKELEVDDVDVERGLALIMIVGEGMRFTVGLAARATRALADVGVNVEMLNQGSSEISMMFGVKAESRRRAVRSLYDTFFAETS